MCLMHLNIKYQYQYHFVMESGEIESAHGQGFSGASRQYKSTVSALVGLLISIYTVSKSLY